MEEVRARAGQVMKIISWNVNGIRAIHKKGLFLPFVKKYQPDILCLQETKVGKDEVKLDLPDYAEYWSSAERPGYSGTAIFVQNSLASPQLSFSHSSRNHRLVVRKVESWLGQLLKVSTGLPKNIEKKYKLEDSYGDPNKEGRLLAVEFKNFFVVSVYTPNAKDDLSRLPLRHKEWDPAFLDYMKSLGKKKPVIFCGDLNVAHTPDDLARPKENEGRKGFTKEEREGIDKIIEAGFVDTFRIFTTGNGHYTWWSHFANARARNVGWRIDYIFVSQKLAKKVKSAKILPEVQGSDHCPVMIEI